MGRPSRGNHPPDPVEELNSDEFFANDVVFARDDEDEEVGAGLTNPDVRWNDAANGIRLRALRFLRH